MAASTRFALVAVACFLSGPIGCSVFFPSSHNEPPVSFELHAVRANSVGYLTGRAKTVTIVLPPDMTSLTDTSADVRSAANDTVVWSCEVTGPISDPDTGTTVYLGDFTPFDSVGDYYIALPNLIVDGKPARSATFHVGPDVFATR